MSSTANAATADLERLAAATPARSTRWHRFAAPALRLAAASWYAVAVLGLVFFTVYVTAFYGGALARGQPEDWNKVLTDGWLPADPVGNAVLASHLLLAIAVTLGGLWQLIPAARRRWPAVHRWTGRVFLVSSAIASVGGLYMIWLRKTGGDLSQHVGISANAFLILGFGWLAWRAARERRIDAHRRWALRVFLCVNGGWFFRIGLMLWIVANQGPVGFDPKTFTGPFITFLSFAQYVLPLTALELYLRAQRSGRPLAQLAMAAALGVLTLATLAGIGAAGAILWWPNL